LWWQALERFELAVVERAFRSVIEDPDSGQFMPRPASLIRCIEGDSSEASLVAWASLLDAVRSYGSYRRPELDGPTTAAVESMGGWLAICNSQESDLHWMQRRFSEAYNVYRVREEREVINELLSFDTSVPRLE